MIYGTDQTGFTQVDSIDQSKEPPTIGAAHVLYNFEGRYEDELTVQEGSDVRIVQLYDEWVLCWNSETGDGGIVPLSYLKISLDNEIVENVIEKLETQSSTSTLQEDLPAQELPKESIKIKTEPLYLKQSSNQQVSTPVRNYGMESVKSMQQVEIKNEANEVVQRDNSYRNSLNAAVHSFVNTSNWKQKFASIVAELLNSEIAYLNELNLWETCINQNNRLNEYQKTALTRELPVLCELSQVLIHSLSEQADRPIEEQSLSQIFTANYEWISKVYLDYVQSIEDISQIVESKQDYSTRGALQMCLQQMQSLGVYLIDVQTAVNRPIHRVFEYSLFLNALFKVLPSLHSDHSNLLEAKNQMDSFVSALNESKTQSQIAKRYQNNSNASIAEKLSKLNLHSFQKKSKRLSYRIASSFGLVDMPDLEFSWMTDEVNKAKSHLDEFICNVETYKNRVVSMTTKFIKATTIETKKLPSQAVEVLRWKFNAYLKMLSVFLQNYQQLIETDIEVPTRSLGKNDCSKLIEKRCDKMADYEMARAQKGSVDELERLRREFEALNLHLKNNLPKIWTDLNSQISALSQKLIELDQDFFDRVNVYLNDLPVKLRIFTLPNFEKFVDPAGQRLFSFRKQLWTDSTNHC